MCTPSATTWTSLLAFLVGVATAIFAPLITRWVSRPVLQVSFEPETCDKTTPTQVKNLATGKEKESLGRWVRVRVRTKNSWLRSRIAKGCRAHLINVEIEQENRFRPSGFVDTLRLQWSSKPPDEVLRPLDIPSDVAQFVDVLAADRNTPGSYSLQTGGFLPFYCQHLFDGRPTALRLTVLVTSDDAKAGRARFVFRWTGAWDTFEASAR
jgi:hypothetical protein